MDFIRIELPDGSSDRRNAIIRCKRASLCCFHSLSHPNGFHPIGIENRYRRKMSFENSAGLNIYNNVKKASKSLEAEKRAEPRKSLLGRGSLT